ncbi:MAG: BatA domain-containing protein [Puniceicoccales bacterium]|jgi:hypothetical protein|nr:BatA domain-containing protein [Puniceicoccales bacterium]
MQVDQPMFFMLLPIILVLIFIKPKIRLGTIIWPNIQFVKQTNRQIGYKQWDWLFALRLCSLVGIILSLCEIVVCGVEISPYLVKFVAFTTLGEIILKNTTLRTLP